MEFYSVPSAPFQQSKVEHGRINVLVSLLLVAFPAFQAQAGVLT